MTRIIVTVNNVDQTNWLVRILFSSLPISYCRSLSDPRFKTDTEVTIRTLAPLSWKLVDWKLPGNGCSRRKRGHYAARWSRPDIHTSGAQGKLGFSLRTEYERLTHDSTAAP